MLRLSLRLESEQHANDDTKQGFLNSVNKILQIAVTNDQRRMLIDVMVSLVRWNTPTSAYETKTVRVRNQNPNASGRARTRPDAYRGFICTHLVIIDIICHL